jgi:flap endonuclease-1
MCRQFLQIVVGRKGSELLTNEAGEVTRQETSLALPVSDHCIPAYLTFHLCELCSHLQGMLNRTVRMLEAGIKPV